MLSGEEILKQIEIGNIVIKPFCNEQLNPNSYNLTLGEDLLVYVEGVLDCAKEAKVKSIKIPDEGYTLIPGNLYLVKTNEYTETDNLVPQISGRSSIGRIGLHVHISAGFGDNGYKGFWNLGLSCTAPVNIFKGMQIGQIYYFPLIGSANIKYQGKYGNDSKVSKSKLYIEFDK